LAWAQQSKKGTDVIGLNLNDGGKVIPQPGPSPFGVFKKGDLKSVSKIRVLFVFFIQASFQR
jgi:hypothetical protein